MARTSRVLAGAIALAALLAPSVPAVAAADVAAAAPVRVMPLGDSITDGFNVPGGYRVDLWQKFVAGGYSVDFVGSAVNGPSSLGDRDHEGHSGWTIAQIDSNVTNWLRTYTPETILLHIGTNDMYGGDPAGAPNRLSALVDRITTLAPNARLFVATITPLSSYDSTVRTFNATIPPMVQSKANAGKKVYLVDQYRALTTADLADGVHPNAGGYSKMATAWYNALLSVPGSIGNGGNQPPDPVGACTATSRVVNSWGGGYQGEITVRNTATSALNGWTVRMTLPGGQSLANIWGGVNTGTSGAVTVKNAAYNGSVGAGASTTFGFVVNGGSSTPGDLTCASP
ncbi:cellulose binding domain-containing protein [Saccharothrix deserti]|uniref:cellulose binding domain-containing protein n=1 Tax=Saccharothrix deserti TaxID=2593674 RepID=UPI00131AF822|nr:cellulose binding domain-containing protein [Saccharothrix deserti]